MAPLDYLARCPGVVTAFVLRQLGAASEEVFGAVKTPNAGPSVKYIASNAENTSRG